VSLKASLGMKLRWSIVRGKDCVVAAGDCSDDHFGQGEVDAAHDVRSSRGDNDVSYLYQIVLFSGFFPCIGFYAFYMVHKSI